MKKSLVITIALALLLVLCVSCSSDGKKGKIVIDTSALKEVMIEGDSEDVKLLDVATKAELVLENNSVKKRDNTICEKYELNLKNVKKGEVSVKVPAGAYNDAGLFVYYGEEKPEAFELVRVPGTKDRDVSYEIIINPGHTLYFEVYVHEE